MAVQDLTKNYSESFNSLSDAEKQQIRRNLLGLNEEGDNINFSGASYLASQVDKNFLSAKVGQQDAFRGLAADLLTTTVNKLKEQKAKEAEFDMYKSLDGFGEIANMGGNLSNSILGELGSAAGMAGIGSEQLTGGDLEDQITNMAGLGFLQGAQYNWQKWFDETLSKRYEDMKEIQGTSEAQATYELEKKFMDDFVKDYIKPRFDYSRSIDEFINYIDVKQDEENILQTETTLNSYKDLVAKKTAKFYQDLKNKKVGFDSSFYADPLSKYTLNEDGETYKGLSNSKAAEYLEQKDKFNKHWEAAKDKPDKARKLLGGKSWSELALQYGYDINNKDQFAKLHYNAVGHKKKFDGAKDLISEQDITDFINEEIMPKVAETDLKFGNKPFMEFVSPEKYADDLLGDYNVGTEEYQEALEDLGIDSSLGVDDIREQIVAGLQTTGADEIRAKIKYYNEKKKKPSQKLIGVSYIERKEDYDKNAKPDDANALYTMFANSGYEGTQEEFFEEFMPDANPEEMDMLTDALGGGTGFGDMDLSDPFSALGTLGGALGDEPEDMFGDKAVRSSSKDKSSSYFDIFGDQEKEYDDYTNKYSGMQDLGSFGSFNYF